MGAVVIIEVRPRAENLNGFGTGARQPIEQPGMQPLAYKNVGGYGANHQ